MPACSRFLLLVTLAGSLACTGGRERPAATRSTSAGATSAPTPSTTSASVQPPVLRPGSHDDHSPRHGGIFYMDGNLYHHLEGAYPEAGVFRLYLYDDYTKPVDPKGTTGTIQMEGATDAPLIPLEHDAGTQTLVARIDPAPALPVKLVMRLDLTNPLNGVTKQSLFHFEFKAVGGEASAPHAGGAPHAHPSGEHGHGSPHGGQVQTAGAGHHLELVVTPGMLTLWVLDAQERTLPVDGMQATLLLQPEGGAPVTVPLPPMGSVHFMANSPLKPDAKGVAVATVRMPDGTKTARFTFGGAP